MPPNTRGTFRTTQLSLYHDAVLVTCILLQIINIGCEAGVSTCITDVISLSSVYMFT